MNGSNVSRRAIIGGLAAMAVGFTGCSRDSGGSGGGSPSAPEEMPLSERDAYIAKGPAPLDPASFAHGAFVGAMDLEYLGERTSETAKAADADYQVYFKGNYTPPKPGEHNVIRLNSMGDPRDGERLLFKGAIMDNITPPHEIVLGLHNITLIEGGVELNGEYYEGRVAGANGTQVIGDRLTVWTPDPLYPDLVDQYVYEVVESETGGDYTVVTVGPGYEDLIYKASPSEDVYQLSLYVCWPPRQIIQRLVTRFHLIEASVVPGSVKSVDA